VDRVVIRESPLGRIAEAVEQATKLAEGRGSARWASTCCPTATSGARGHGPASSFSTRSPSPAPIHGHSIDDLQPRDFSFNAPYGACPDCDGLGTQGAWWTPRPRGGPDKDAQRGRRRHSGASSAAPTTIRRSSPPSAATWASDEHTPWEDLPKKRCATPCWTAWAARSRVDYHTVDGRDTYWYIVLGHCASILFEK
jgi:excinuclease ABC subunit A